MRIRVASELFKPEWDEKKKRDEKEQDKKSSSHNEPEQPEEGPDLLAVLPAVRPRPANTPEDARTWMPAQIITGIPPRPLTIFAPFLPSKF